MGMALLAIALGMQAAGIVAVRRMLAGGGLMEAVQASFLDGCGRGRRRIAPEGWRA